MRARLAAAGIPDPVIDSIVLEHEALRCRFPFGAFAADRAVEAACASTTERALGDELQAGPPDIPPAAAVKALGWS